MRSNRISVRHRRGNFNNNRICIVRRVADPRPRSSTPQASCSAPTDRCRTTRPPTTSSPSTRTSRTPASRRSRRPRSGSTRSLRTTSAWYARSYAAARTKDRGTYPSACTQVTQKTRQLNEEPDKVMLAKLRVLEKKMGLVLTLVRPLNSACVHAIPC